MPTTKQLPPFKEWFFDKFREWEEKQPGKRSTYTAFAIWLSDNSFRVDFKQQLVNDWIRGKYKPSEDKYLLALEEKLGKEIYQIVGLIRPNPYLQKVNQFFERLSPDRQRQIADEVERYGADNEEENAQQSSKERKTSPR